MNNIKDRVISFLLGISIKSKIYGIVFAVITLIGVSSLIEVRLSLTETLSKQLDEKVKAVGRDVAARSADLLLTNNVYLLQETVRETVRNNEDVRYVFLLDEKNKVLVHTFGEQGISEALVLANEVKPTDKYSLKKFMTEDGLIRDVAVPVIEGIGGTVRVGLTETSLLQALSRITTQLLVTMFVVFVISGIIAYGLTKLLTSPITQLVNVTKEVSQGNLSVRAFNAANDEIGELTNAFNQMLSDLEKTGRERDQFNQEIILRNRELSLLNELTGNVTSLHEMRFMLERFLERLVKGLQLNSGIIHVKLIEKTETLKYSTSDCWHDQVNCSENQACLCHVSKEKKWYNFTIEIRERTIGQLQICSCQELDEQSLKILNSLSAQIAIAVENMRLWHELKQKEKLRLKLLEKVIKAQEEERKRIARELHDETSQSLTSILLGLSVLAEKKDNEERLTEINHLRNLMQHTLREVHELAWQLRPSVLDKFGLSVVLERYIDEYKKKFLLDVDLCMIGLDDIRLQSEVEVAIYRMIQEALTNVARYAQAKNVSVIIEKKQDMLLGIIEDDGVGFDVKQVLNRDPSKYNLGLHGMQERAVLLGGSLTIESEQGRGTTIFVKVPIQEEGEFANEEN